MQKIKLNDEVIVTTGKDRGKTGKIVKILDGRVVVSGVNMSKKHVKPNPNKNIEGGIIAKEMSLHISNVALYNPATKKADRVGFKVSDGKNVRFFKSSNALVDAK